MKMTRGFGSTCCNDQAKTVNTFAVAWLPLCRYVFGGPMNRPPSISRKMSRNDPDRLVLSAVDDFVRDATNVEVFHL
jgi:hypothetical protein